MSLGTVFLFLQYHDGVCRFSPFIVCGVTSLAATLSILCSALSAYVRRGTVILLLLLLLKSFICGESIDMND